MVNRSVLAQPSIWLSIVRYPEQEPGTTFSLIDPVLDETCSGDVAVVIAQAVRQTQPRRQTLG